MITTTRAAIVRDRLRLTLTVYAFFIFGGATSYSTRGPCPIMPGMQLVSWLSRPRPSHSASSKREEIDETCEVSLR